MKIDYEFEVGVPLDLAWSTMLDLEEVVSCLPGASLTGESDGGYEGIMKVEIGPVNVGYKGTVKVEEADEADHRAVLRATGRDARGQGTASATIVSTMQEAGENTKVVMETDVRLTGRASQFGRDLTRDVVTGILDEFAACLEREASSGTGPADGSDTRADAPDGQTPSAAAPTGAADETVVNDPEPAAGATVEGAVIAGSSPTEAAAGAPTTSTPQPTTRPLSRREGQRKQEASDLAAADQKEVLRRLGPVLAAGVLVVLLWLLRRRR